MNTPLSNFFKAYSEEQAALGKHLSAHSELERKKKELCTSLAKQYDQFPGKLILNSPFGQMLLTFDIYGEAIIKIEIIERLQIDDGTANPTNKSLI